MKIYIIEGNEHFKNKDLLSKDHTVISGAEDLQTKLNDLIKYLDPQNQVQVSIDLPTLRASVIDLGRPSNIAMPTLRRNEP